MTKALAFVKRKRGLRREDSSLVEERESRGREIEFFFKKKTDKKRKKDQREEREKGREGWRELAYILLKRERGVEIDWDRYSQRY